MNNFRGLTMKTTRIFIYGLLLAIAAASGAQPLPLGAVRSNVDPAQREAAIEAKQAELAGMAQPMGGPLGPQGVPPAPVAEAVTADIQQLARNLENDPLRIFNYVHDHIRHVLYFGAKKGAELTYLEKSGNDFDQCALLVALLRSAGYTNLAYQFGWMKLPYDSADHKDLHHWLQLSLSNTNWNYTSNYLNELIYWYRGYPARAAIWDTNTFAFQRVWVVLTNGASVYYLDPSFKVSEPISGINLQTATGFNSTNLLSAAGGTDTGYCVTNLSEASVRGTLTMYTTNLLNYIQSNSPNASVAQVLGGWQIVASTNTFLSPTLNFATYEWGGQMPILTWANEPTNLMSSLTVSFTGTNWYQCFIPQLQGQRLTLTFDNNGLGQLWIEDTTNAQAQTSGSGWSDVELYINHPIGYWNTNNNTFVDTTAYDESCTNYYNNWRSTYGLIYGFEPDWGWLRARQDKLDAYRQQGLAEDSRQVVSETMNAMGLSYLMQGWSMEQIGAAQMGILPQCYHHIGRLSQELGAGYYFDFLMWSSANLSAAGEDAAIADLRARFMGALCYFDSALEHGVIEQLQGSNLVAASTVKMLEVAITNGQAIYLANSTNWTAGANVKGKLYGYGYYDYDTFDSLIASGATLLLPQVGDNYVNGSSGWNGYGYVLYIGPGNAGMRISGQYYGGQVSDRNATVNPPYVAAWAHGQPSRLLFMVDATAADPVDTANGTFQTQQTDLSLGQAEPRGISFGRYYNSRNRLYSQSGMAPGWSHNYNVAAHAAAAPQASFGGTTPAQMAPILAATCAAFGIYNDAQQDPKNWTVTALIAKWATDQLTKSGISVAMAADIVQFVQQPDGRFTPPANCTWTLTKPGNYVLQERHGNTFNFDSLGRLSSIVDPYSQTLSVSYLSTTSALPQQVTDWKNRYLQFSYKNGSLLTNVTDSTGRKVSYGYSAGGDLTSITDPENKSSTFGYDTNHQITAALDGLNHLVVSNLFDGSGRVTTQSTQGSTNQTWQVYCSGWQTVVQDPAGSKQRYFYDDKNRLVGLQDALSNLSVTFYDGQNHAVLTVSPLNETNQFLYDGNHNLLAAIDQLGYSNQFSYNANFTLSSSVDKRGNTSRFGYNTQFSLTGSTNGAGDWVTLDYNSDGTPKTRTDSGSITSYGSDQWGQLNSIGYPGSLGSEGFLNNALGDVLSHTNARGFVTSFVPNNRREITNTIAPTNLTMRVAYDAADNVQSLTDARGFTTTSFWSPTRRLTGTVFPTTPQGIPATTNLYDNRDWLSRRLDPLQQPTGLTNDLAGRLISTTDPLSRTTRFGFDADGRQRASTNAAQEVVRQQWSPRGEMMQFTDPATHSVNYGFDGAGNQSFLTNRNGKFWQTQFDKANRLTNTITPKLYSTKRAFNDRGLLFTVRDPMNQWTTNFYDARARLTNVTDAAGVRLYSFDGNNNLTGVTNAGQGAGLAWGYDAYDRVRAFTNAEGYVIQYRWDANGNLTNLIYPGNRTVTYFYDSLNRLTNVTDWASGHTSFTYDLANRLTSVTRPNGTVRQMNYDVAGQLTNIVEKTTTGFPIAFFTLGWTNSGRVAWEFAAPLPHSNAPPSRTMYYDDDNRLLTVGGLNVAHDDDGNLTSGPLTNSTFVAYAYNARNWLMGAGGLQYGYDPVANRTSLTNGATVTRFVVNPNATLPQVLMRIKPGVTNYYIYGLGLLYEVRETATSTRTLTYHYDYRGSTVALTDSTGLPTDQIEYSSYGTTTYRAGTNDTPFLYNGRYGVMTDANGLLYMRARYYNPYLCRFINADPAGFAGGLNWYCYANGNPVSSIDPFGLCPEDFNTGYRWLDYGLDLTAKGGEGAMGLVTKATMLALKGVWKTLEFADRASHQPGSGGVEPGPQSLVLLLYLASDGLPALLRTVAAEERMVVAETAPEVLWPANRGFMAGEGGQASVLPGQVLDRYGGTGGNFLAPAGTPAAARSLAPGVELRPLTSYEVLQPFEAGAGRAAPWFGQPGLGLQFDLGTRTVQDLINAGALRPIP